MNKREKLAFGIVAALAMTSGGIAYGQSVNNISSDQVIYACVTGVNGNIVKVSNTRKTCPRGTTPIQWNVVGQTGEQGKQGLPGLQGLQGEKGDSNSKITPELLLSGPGSQLFPYFATPWGYFVQIDNSWWSWDGNQIRAEDLGLNKSYYTTEDCSGEPFLVSEFSDLPALRKTHMVWSDNSIESGATPFYLVNSSMSTTKLQSKFSDGVCISRSAYLANQETQLSEFNNSIQSARQAVFRFSMHLQDLKSQVPSWTETSNVQYSFGGCEIQVSKTDEWVDWAISKYDDCFDTPQEYQTASSCLTPSNQVDFEEGSWNSGYLGNIDRTSLAEYKTSMISAIDSLTDMLNTMKSVCTYPYVLDPFTPANSTDVLGTKLKLDAPFLNVENGWTLVLK